MLGCRYLGNFWARTGKHRHETRSDLGTKGALAKDVFSTRKSSVSVRCQAPDQVSRDGYVGRSEGEALAWAPRGGARIGAPV